MRNDLITILRAAGEFLLLAGFAALVPGFVAIDLLVFGQVGEVSLTETTQETLLLISAGVFGFLAWKRPEARGFCVLVAGFLACMLIRELDYLFDMIRHGFWLWPALLTAFLSIGATALRWRQSVIRPMARFVGTKPYFFILVGLVIVLVFSRIFGSGNLLWSHVLESGYSTLFRGPLQEGLELLGYMFLTYGSFLMLREKHTKPNTQNHEPAAATET